MHYDILLYCALKSRLVINLYIKIYRAIFVIILGRKSIKGRSNISLLSFFFSPHIFHKFNKRILLQNHLVFTPICNSQRYLIVTISYPRH